MGPPVFQLDVVVICADGHRRAGLGGCIRNEFRMVIERQRVVSTNGEKVRLRGKFSLIHPPRVEHHLFGAGLDPYSATYTNSHTDSYTNADAPTVYRLQRPYRRRCLTRDHGV